MLHYARAVDSTMLVAIGTIASAQSKGTEATARPVTQLLKYCATHPDATIRYHASDMELLIDSDSSSLSEVKSRSRAADYYYLISAPKDPTNAPNPPHNGAIHALSQIMAIVVSSAAEAELGSTFLNGKEGPCSGRLSTTWATHNLPLQSKLIICAQSDSAMILFANLAPKLSTCVSTGSRTE
jgi:hypothetical protein